MRVRFAVEARDEIEAALAWWRANREKAPELLAREIRQALRLIKTAPHAGRSVRSERLRDARVLVLSKTGFVRFYRVVDDEVRVLALSHGAREPMSF